MGHWLVPQATPQGILSLSLCLWAFARRSCSMSCDFASFAVCKASEVRWFGKKKKKKRGLDILLCVAVIQGKGSKPLAICLCLKHKGSNCRVEIKGESGTELPISSVWLTAFGTVLSSDYETMPCVYGCHLWFAKRRAGVAGLAWTPCFPPLCSHHPEPFQIIWGRSQALKWGLCGAEAKMGMI